MNDNGLEDLFELARGAKSPLPPPAAGFANRVYDRYQFELARERTATRASFVSISVAVMIFAAIVGLNLDAFTSTGTDDQDPVDEVTQVLWDSAGN
jgi:hypothetical protein